MSVEPLTTVVSVRGQSPDAWQDDPSRIYVGRYVPLRSGKFIGQVWKRSLFSNPLKLSEDPTMQERRELLVRYQRYLAGRPELLSQLHTMAGKQLGCWCGTWDGISEPRLLCHASVLADWCNGLSQRPWEEFQQ